MKKKKRLIESEAIELLT